MLNISGAKKHKYFSVRQFSNNSCEMSDRRRGQTWCQTISTLTRNLSLQISVDGELQNLPIGRAKIFRSHNGEESEDSRLLYLGHPLNPISICPYQSVFCLSWLDWVSAPILTDGLSQIFSDIISQWSTFPHLPFSQSDCLPVFLHPTILSPCHIHQTSNTGENFHFNCEWRAGRARINAEER